jgi:hypothetical protein
MDLKPSVLLNRTDIMYDLIISLTGEVCVYETSLILPLILSACINVGKCAVIYKCVRGIDIASLYDFSIGFVNCSVNVIFFFILSSVLFFPKMSGLV